MKPFGKYQLVRRIAAGGMAEVYLATGPNPRGDELLALKLILQHIAEDESFMSMFLQEARLTAPLIHPNLVQVFDLGMTDGRLYLAMEYIRGRPLSEVLKRAQEQRQPFGHLLAAGAVHQACLGLNHAHEARDAQGRDLGLVHRDVSPQNLMLDEAGVVKVVDFGVAKATSQSEVSRAGSLKGKVGFMAPEQLKSKPLDRRVDVFALGVVLFELATGKPLFTGRSDAEILQRMLFEAPPDMRAHGLPQPLTEIIVRATERDRAKRYATAEEMAGALDAFLGPKAATVQKQLSVLMRALFPPSPRSVAEAEAEVSASGRARPTSDGVLVSREARVREPTPTDPTRAARPSAGRGEAPRTRSGERPVAGRPRYVTGPTDPGPPGPELTVKASEQDRLVTAPQPPVPDELEPPTNPDFRRPRRAAPTGLADDENDDTTSTLSESIRERPRAESKPWVAVAAAGAGAAGVMGLAYLLWRVLMGGAPAAPAPELAVVPGAAVDAGLAAPVTAVEPSPTSGDAGAEADASGDDEASPDPRARGPRKTGTLTVVTAPWSMVVVDGRDLGATPLLEYVLPVGKHKVVLTNPDQNLVKQTEVVIHARRTTDLRLKLK